MTFIYSRYRPYLRPVLSQDFRARFRARFCARFWTFWAGRNLARNLAKTSPKFAFFSRGFCKIPCKIFTQDSFPPSPALKTLHHGGRGGGEIDANNRTEAAFSGSDWSGEHAGSDDVSESHFLEDYRLRIRRRLSSIRAAGDRRLC